LHTSTIIGARTVSQLEDNLKGLDLQLKKEQLEPLSKLTEPTLDFPAAFLQRARGGLIEWDDDQRCDQSGQPDGA
jgi:diketogulonate reductase-like aldo/keto reductase